MYLTSLESKVLSCGKNRIVARAIRGSGKTELAIKWARERKGKKVLFATDVFDRSKVWHSLITNRYGNCVLNSSTRTIEFEDGTVIYLIDSRGLAHNYHRGISYDCLVVDDAEYVSHKWVGYLPEKVLILGSRVSGEENNFMQWALKSPEFHVVYYDYLDAIRDGMLTLQEAYNLYESMSYDLKSFQESFGPWH